MRGTQKRQEGDNSCLVFAFLEVNRQHRPLLLTYVCSVCCPCVEKNASAFISLFVRQERYYLTKL
jgi:hypothetical protein